MPIYRYRCKTQVNFNKGTVISVEHCNQEYDVLYTSQSKVTEEEPKEVCPACGGVEKERLINTGTSFTLKGEGWFHKGGY